MGPQVQREAKGQRAIKAQQAPRGRKDREERLASQARSVQKVQQALRAPLGSLAQKALLGLAAGWARLAQEVPRERKGSPASTRSSRRLRSPRGSAALMVGSPFTEALTSTETASSTKMRSSQRATSAVAVLEALGSPAKMV